LVPLTTYTCLQRLSEVRWQIVADSRSSCIEGSVAEVGARPTDEKRTSGSFLDERR